MNYDNWRKPEPKRNRHSGLKWTAGLVALTFTATLAYVVGNRLSDEALGVLAGAVCGVGAAIPTTLLVLVVTRAIRNGSGGQRQEQERQAMYTQPMIVPPAMVFPHQLPPQQERQAATWHHVPRRQFEIVGEPED